MYAKRIFGICLIPYALWLIFFYRYHFIDGANLLFHEAGHVFFGFLGETMQYLGGTLGQFVFPTACAMHFLLRNQRFEAAVCGLWFGENMMYTAVYLGDARAQVLPLVGGGDHDWNWLLSKAGLLNYCEKIASGIHVVASLVVLACLAAALREAFRKPEKDVFPE